MRRHAPETLSDACLGDVVGRQPEVSDVVVHMPVGYEEIKKLQEMSGSGSLSDKV